jgi:alkylhydroperoxidase family enzyme
MARLQPLRNPDDPELRQLYEQMSASLGAVPNVLATMAHHKEIFIGLWGFMTAVNRSAALDRRLLELAYLKTSLINQCHY